MQPDLFTHASYPRSPGFKAAGTSAEASTKIASKAETLRQRVLQHLEEIAPFGKTADEISASIGEHFLSIRPRVSELSALGRIQATGERRKNESGMSAAVWRVR